MPLALRRRRPRTRRAIIAAARKRAPRHPRGPEEQLRHATYEILTLHHAELKRRILAVARERLDAKGDKKSSGIADAANAHARAHIQEAPFQRRLLHATGRVAQSARDQTAQALNKGRDFQPDLAPLTGAFAGDVAGELDDRIEQSTDDALEALAEWDDDDDADIDDLDEALDEIAGDRTGAAMTMMSAIFAAAFADMIAAAQDEAGVEQYVWIATLDDATRDAHADLDGEICSWDDPPLSAADSSNGEDCHPGEDYNCRCEAAPIDPADAEAEQ